MQQPPSRTAPRPWHAHGNESGISHSRQSARTAYAGSHFGGSW
jgi:hypothetical protein